MGGLLGRLAHGRPDLGMVVYNPASPEDADKVNSLIGPPDLDPSTI
jgi:hypothetical protein